MVLHVWINGDLNARNYFNDLNAVQRVIDGLTGQELLDVADVLYEMCGSGNNWLMKTALMLKATPAQKVEAILRATGKLEEGDGVSK